MARWACAWVGLVVAVGCNSPPGGASSSAAPAPSHATSEGMSAAGSGPATPPEVVAATSAARTPGIPWPNAPLPEAPLPSGAPRGALLTLHVTNQSSVTPTIDIQVSVDGRRVVDHVFPFEDAHTKLTVEIPLDAGHHPVSIIGNQGAVRLDTSFDAKGHQWAWASYWYELPAKPGGPDRQPSRFTFYVSDEPSYLR